MIYKFIPTFGLISTVAISLPKVGINLQITLVNSCSKQISLVSLLFIYAIDPYYILNFKFFIILVCLLL